MGLRPLVEFSFLQHDFGPCFVSVPGHQPLAEQVVLRLLNNDPTTTFSIDTTFQKCRDLDVQLNPAMLEPGHTFDVPFLFTPRAVQDYEFIVPFVINGTLTVNVKVGRIATGLQVMVLWLIVCWNVIWPVAHSGDRPRRTAPPGASRSHKISYSLRTGI